MNLASNLVEQVRNGQAPQNIREFAAQGMLPLSEEELIPLQILLLQDPLPEIVQMASSELHKVSDESWLRLVERKEPDPEVVDYILKYKPDSEDIKEKILLNHSVSDAVFEKMAAGESGKLVDVVLNNHVRLLRDGEILASLERNPALTPDQRRRIEEFKTEFIYKKQKAEESLEIPLASLEDLLAQIPNLDQEAQRWIQEIDQTEEERPTPEQVQATLSQMFHQDDLNSLPLEIISVYQKILSMKHAEKVRVALLGGREERSFLIRDASRQIAALVLRNPKLTDAEMENFATMRNIDSDLLRQMGMNRAFVKRYSVLHSLIRNPKTPSPTSLNLIRLLREADLKNLERDKNIPDVIRRQAKKLRDQKELKKH